MPEKDGGWALKSELVFREIAGWIIENRALQIKGPCDLFPHAHRFIAEIKELMPSEVKRFWQAINKAHDRYVLKEVPAERGKCLTCGRKCMTFRRVPPLNDKGRWSRNVFMCNVCGMETSQHHPHYQCMTPEEARAPHSVTAKFTCPGTHCSACYGKYV